MSTQDQLLEPGDAFEIELGVRPADRTLRKYRHKGLRGRKLRTAYVLGKHLTKREWVREFVGTNEPASA